MSKTDDECRLEDVIKCKEYYTTKAISMKAKNSKREIGTQQKAIVAIMIESTFFKDFNNGLLNKSCKYFK